MHVRSEPRGPPPHPWDRVGLHLHFEGYNGTLQQTSLVSLTDREYHIRLTMDQKHFSIYTLK